jgi:hypothetical protein
MSPSLGRYLHTELHEQKNAYRHPCLEWDSNPRSEREETVHALDRAATAIGTKHVYECRIFMHILCIHICNYIQLKIELRLQIISLQYGYSINTVLYEFVMISNFVTNPHVLNYTVIE